MSDEIIEEVSGSVGAQLSLQADDGKSLVTMIVRGVDHGPSGRDEMAIGVLATLFKHIFKPGFSQHQVTADDICVVVQVPTDYLADEWVTVVEQHPNSGGDFKLERGNNVAPLNIPIIKELPDEEG